MKLMTLLVVAGAITLGGCASTENGSAQTAAAKGEESYVSLGSNIPRKGARRKEDQNADLQQLENARIQNNGAINGSR